jgi:DNA polymerase
VSDERKQAVAEIAAEALGHLVWLKEAGVQELPRPQPVARTTPIHAPTSPPASIPASTPTATPTATSTATSTATPTATTTATTTPASTSTSTAYSLNDKGCGSQPLLAIRQELGDCRRCKLAGGRTHLVFGVGNPKAELMFVGEGPGADEDQQGEPFVGKAGQLLTKMIEAMGYRREQVYIANVVKCRPPGNRNPEPDEIEACEPFLRRQIEAVRPKVIVALGKFAAQTLLRSTIPITKLRGTWSSYGGVRLMPTFHPAYLLRSPQEKKTAWADLQLVMAELGKAPPAR